MSKSGSAQVRVLCLHGSGSNSRVFESQTAALRHELGDGFSWHFVEGTVPAPLDHELEGYFPEHEEYFSYFLPHDTTSLAQALTDLEEYIILEGPFDIITAVSGGSSLAASLMIRNAQEHPEQDPLFKGAVFFSGITPFDYAALSRNEIQMLDPATDGILITVPTANIWGANDEKHAKHSSTLSQLCNAQLKEDFVHDAKSGLPGAGAEETLIGAVHAIRKTVDGAISTC